MQDGKTIIINMILDVRDIIFTVMFDFSMNNKFTFNEIINYATNIFLFETPNILKTLVAA